MNQKLAAQIEESTYYDEEEESEEESDSDDYDDEDEYEEASSIGSINSDTESFIEKFGHLDFHLLNFLPKIKTKQELVNENR
jgi:hypothetical protein